MLLCIRLVPALLLLQLASAASDFYIKPESKKVELLETEKKLGGEKVLKRTKSISLRCSLISTANLMEPKIQWLLPGNASLDNERYEVSDQQPDKRTLVSTLTIKDLQADDIGNYTCKGFNASRETSNISSLMSPPLPSVSERSVDIVRWPGESLNLTCTAAANPPATVEWTDQTRSKGATLLFEKITQEDRGEYKCVAENSLGSNSITINLRVKNPNAYIVPLIIIVAELAVLAIIIAVYELAMRKKRQQEADGDKTD